MGFAVDHEVVTLTAAPDVYAEAEAAAWWRAPEPWVALARALSEDGAYRNYAHSMAALWRDLMTPLSDHQRALFIGHSGELEAAVVACLPEADWCEFGPTFGPCEGVRLCFEGDPRHWRNPQLLRLGDN